MTDFQTIETNQMADVTGGGVGSLVGKGVRWVGRNWQGIVSAADLAYQAGKDFLGGKKEQPAPPQK